MPTISTSPSIADALQIIWHPHPTLRRKSLSLTRVDAELKRIAERMFELMYSSNGIGLAANQVGLPLRMFVMNLAGKKGEGEEIVVLNPVLSKPRGNESMEEGCLSLPGIYYEVTRPRYITIDAYTITGDPIQAELDGMLSRCVQHEVDHLDGVLFIDRVAESVRKQVDAELEEFEVDFDSRRNTGSIGSDAEIEKYCQEIEQRYCRTT